MSSAGRLTPPTWHRLEGDVVKLSTPSMERAASSRDPIRFVDGGFSIRIVIDGSPSARMTMRSPAGESSLWMKLGHLPSALAPT